jgi:DNA-binding MarR family transcriptional regulator
VKTREIRRFRTALRQFERLVGVQLKYCRCGVTFAQCLVLLDIDESGRLTMGQLASHLKLDHSTLTRTVDGLVKRKLVRRLRDDSDRRIVLIELTANGVSRCRDIHRDNDAYCGGVFKIIPPSERGAVIRNFEILVQAYLDFETKTEGAKR